MSHAGYASETYLARRGPLGRCPSLCYSPRVRTGRIIVSVLIHLTVDVREPCPMPLIPNAGEPLGDLAGTAPLAAP
jgi:hypothetical protein